MRLARTKQVDSGLIFINFRGVFGGLLLLSILTEALSRHVKDLKVEKFAESKPKVESANWGTTAIMNFIPWDPTNASATTLTSTSIPRFRRKKNLLRFKRNHESPNTSVTFTYQSSQQTQFSAHESSIVDIKTFHQSITPTKSFVTSSEAENSTPIKITPTINTFTKSEHHIQLRTSTEFTAFRLASREKNSADWLTASISSSNKVTTHQTEQTNQTDNPTHVTSSVEGSGNVELSGFITEYTEGKKILQNFTVPTIGSNFEDEDIDKIVTSEFYDGAFNATNSTIVEANSISDVNNNGSVVTTTELQENIWPPLLSSNNADSIASDPTVESVNGGRDLLGIGAIIGIIFGVLVIVILVSGIFGFFIYHKKLRPLSEVKYPTDNCGYVDDSLRVSYMNNHIELPKENSEEMFSLDNDSFLNSLEAMTLQNYWAEDAKNTKV